MDELRENGGSVLVNEMEAFLKVPVVPISAAKGEGIEELVKHAVHVAKYQEGPDETDFCADRESGIHRGLHAVTVSYTHLMSRGNWSSGWKSF